MTKTTEEKVAVMQAFANGAEIESCIYLGSSYEETTAPSWNWYKYDYRVKETKPSINWDHVREDIIAIARDEDGCIFGFDGLPRKYDRHWHKDNCVDIRLLASLDPGTCDWKDSLVLRPVCQTCDKQDTCADRSCDATCSQWEATK